MLCGIALKHARLLMELAKQIELAPKNGDFVILQDGWSGSWEVGRWAEETSSWVQIDGKPLRIFPTHWVPVSGDPAGSENSEGVSFLVPSIQPKETAPKRIRTRSMLAFTAAVIFIGGYAVFDFGFIRAGSIKDANSDRIVGSAVAGLKREGYGERDEAGVIAHDLAAAREEIALHIGREDAVQADAVEAKRIADTRQKELKQALDDREARAETLARELTSVRQKLAAAQEEITLHIGRENAAHAQAMEAKRIADAKQRELKLARDESKARPETRARENNAPAGKPSNKDLVAPDGAVQTETLNRPAQEAHAAPGITGVAPNAQSPDDMTAGTLTVPNTYSASISVAPADAVVDPRQSPAGPSQSQPTSAISSTDETRLVDRAESLIKQSDFAGARLLLERALERGSARAAFMMAETYDWRTLRSLQAYGVRGDTEKARELYELAAVAGIEKARERLEALKTGSNR
jgi:hypothetical protein